ncbi:hypothetical protein FBY04_12048 [Pseudomonas sp. SJZ080]|uniref:DUF3800 domain-containing protein n=1 Tax=Pseudomonas sp. SJZ080 TaxID=2572888 RepID=UPI00119A84BD|nr:DUF3800 domain-containing protein [Pseudomonas sp. SJZ080]TWC50155.1 hypothetical protein FBY04_12048 [Pseudomonas sp. SJZ080]
MAGNVDSVGADSGARYMAFGDDSQYEGVLVFAFIIFKRTRLKSILREFEEVRKRFKFPEGVGIHCRELFSGQRRDKLGLSHLSREDITSILTNLITIINRNEAGLRFAYALEDKVKHMFDEPLMFESPDGGPNIQMPAKYDPKGVLGTLAQACFVVRPDGAHGPQAKDCQIHIAPDTTPVKFLGERKRQAHFLTSGFNDVHPEPGRVYSVEPLIGDGGYPQLLQIADVLAYICAHAMHPEDDKRKYLSLYMNIKKRVRSVYGCDDQL